ncbi:hypothetical protein [Methylomonas koyamae]|uniref:hypothetical protein n=1 Tax=Methylomonas koyamae TaxID=702114 RepID=UPI001125FD29|nr:hypothetical protein [Methylomonas koyamae]TPQ28968.1 hypothetical protein C2U68_03140 [Methylomonas koyamae]
MKKFVEVPLNDVTSKIENAWFQTCRERKVPFITVKNKTKYADVHWDYIAYPTEVDVILDSLGNQLRDSAIEIFKKYANNKSEYSVNGRLIWYKNLELTKAILAAEELYDLIVSCIDDATRSQNKNGIS